MGRMFGQLHAQFADVLHDGVVAAVFVRAPDADVEVFFRKHAVGVERQFFDEVVFFSGQDESRAVDGDGALGVIDGQLVLEGGALFVLLALIAANVCFNAGGQFFHVERFDDVVIGADRKAKDYFVVFVFGGQK